MVFFTVPGLMYVCTPKMYGYLTRPDMKIAIDGYEICVYQTSAPGKDRTCDTRIRNPVLYPLSYGGIGP